MKLRVFRSDKGDCLLLTSGKKRMLIDGGMATSFDDHVAAELSKLKKLDVIYVSHIDEDHISGVLRLMNDLLAWRIHDFQVKNGNPKHKAPQRASGKKKVVRAVPRPPDVAELWHNTFREQIGDNTGEIRDMLAQSGVALANAGPRFATLAARHSELAASVGQAVELSQRAGPGQLGIRVNPPAKGKLMLVRPKAKAFKLGSASIHVIGPFEKDLEELRREWNKWLRESKAELGRIRERSDNLEGDLGNAAVALVAGQADTLTAFANSTLARQNDLDMANAGRPKVLGKRELVTTPNLASLMLFVKEGKQTVLLTGDGHSEDVLAGLKAAKLVTGNKGLHVTVLKALHHGSEHNITQAFCDQITADHYVFCGDGAHTNPELDVIDAMVKGRLENGPAKKFKLWFNANPKDGGTRAEHMKKIEKRVKELATSSEKARKLMSFEFIGKDASALDVL